MSLSELSLILMLVLVLCNNSQLLVMLRFLLVQYKKISTLIKSVKLDIEQEFNKTLNSIYADYADNWHKNINYKSENILIYYQPELNFEAQPELFD